MKNEHPILFSTEMVKAILDGKKTQTRRVITPQPEERLTPLDENRGNGQEFCGRWTYDSDPGGKIWKCPYGSPGDKLWVRETWKVQSFMEYYFAVRYKDGIIKNMTNPPKGYDDIDFYDWQERLVEQSQDELEKLPYRVYDDLGRIVWYDESPLRWRPSIHMPKWVSRIWPEVVGVRVERLQRISTRDIIREGINSGKGPQCCELIKKSLMGKWVQLWDSINENRGYGWDKNPWVWVVEFKKRS